MNKKIKVTMLTAALAMSVIGGAYSYYSGTAKQVQNNFNIVAGQANQENTAGTVKEEHWDPANAKDLQPGQTVSKDPALQSNVAYESWAFATVEIPTITAQKNGDTTDKVYDAVIPNFDTTNWTLIKSSVSQNAGTNSVYIYGFKKKLPAGDKTGTLFTNFTVQDFTKVATPLSDSIDISGTFIQTTGNATLDAAAQALNLK